MKINTIIQGDCLEVLKSFPGNFVDCIVTSPPYYGLRDYGVKGQIGLEPALDEYLNKMLAITAELKRVLKKTGTMWWNHGDSYGGNGAGTTKYADTSKYLDNSKQVYILPDGQVRNNKYLKKSQMLQNYRLVIRMVDEQQWILRNQIIWYKPNVMPSSVKDRFTVDYEPIFFFVKNKKYWFKTQYENYVPNSDVRYRQRLRAGRTYNLKEPYRDNMPYHSIKRRSDDKDSSVVGGGNEDGRNKRTVWKIASKPFKEAHFAIYPEALIEIPIKAGCPEGGVVLDPFIGSGTTAVVAKKLNRDWIGIELNSEYIKIANKRISEVPLQLFS